MPSGAVLSWLEPKSVFCPLSAKSHIIWGEEGSLRSAGGNVGYNMFLIQLMAACATWYVDGGLFWSLCSCKLVFAPNYKDAPLSCPRGAIKARWPTCSDLPKLHFRAPTIHKKNHRARACWTCWEASFFCGWKNIQACFLYNGSSVIDSAV